MPKTMLVRPEKKSIIIVGDDTLGFGRIEHGKDRFHTSLYCRIGPKQILSYSGLSRVLLFTVTS